MKSTTIGLTRKALELVKKESQRLKENGLAASTTSVASEAIIKFFGNEKK